MAPSPSIPFSVRLDEGERDQLGLLGGPKEAGSVLKSGLERMARLKTPTDLPLYPRMVDAPDVDAAVEEAARLACAELDELFPKGPGVELRGISSNFQGLLADHLRAMLTGFEAADRGHRTDLNALLATEHSFGRLPYIERTREYAYTVVRMAERFVGEDKFLDPDHGFVELARLGVGGLYTSPEACVREVMQRLERAGQSPREERLRLCAIEMTDSGPLKVHAVASVGGGPAMSAVEYEFRLATFAATRARA